MYVTQQYNAHPESANIDFSILTERITQTIMMIINASFPPAIVTNSKCHKSIKPTAVYFMRFYESRELSFAVGCFSGHDQVLVNFT